MGTPNMLDPPPHPLFSPLIDSSGTCFWPTQSRAGLGAVEQLLPSSQASPSAPLKGISLPAGLTLAIINRAELGPLSAARCRVPPARAESREIYPEGHVSFLLLAANNHGL